MGDSGVALQRLPSERYWFFPPASRHPRRPMAVLIPPVPLTLLSAQTPTGSTVF